MAIVQGLKDGSALFYKAFASLMKSAINKLNPAEQKKFLEAYRLSLGLKADDLPSEKSFDTYVTQRLSTAAAFTVLKDPLDQQLKSADTPTQTAAKAVQDAIEDALKLTPKTDASKEAYETDITEMRYVIEGVSPQDLLKNLEELDAVVTDPGEKSKLKGIIAEVKEAIASNAPLNQKGLLEDLDALKPLADPANDKKRTACIRQVGLMNAKFHPGDLIRSLEESKKNAITAIKDQHAAAKAALTAKFTDPTFRDNLKKTLSLTTDTQVDDTKTKMLADLDKSHAKEITEFEQSVIEPITKMHRAAQIERDRVSYLATMYKNNKAVQKEIDALYEKNHAANKGRGVTLIIDSKHPSRALFKGIRPEQLSTLCTVTGRPSPINIEKDSTTGKDIALMEIQFANRLLSPHNRHIKADMLSAVGGIRACGNDIITVNMTHKEDPEYAEELARIAAEACLETGFDEKNITMQVNGETKTLGQLFAKSPARLEAARSQAALNKAERETPAPEESNAFTYNKYREALKNGRLSDEEAQEKPTPPSGPVI